MPPAQFAEAEPLGGNRDFKVLLGSQRISALGDAVSFTALPAMRRANARFVSG